MKIFLILLLIYIISGILRIIIDFKQPRINQPQYVCQPTILGILNAFLWSPLNWWDEIRHPLPKGEKEKLKKLKEMEKKSRRLKL